MGRKPQVQTRLEHDTYEDYETYRDSRGLSDAEAARQLIGAGLNAEPLYPDGTDDGDRSIREFLARPFTVSVAGVSMLLSALLLYGAGATAASGQPGLTTVLAVLSLFTLSFAFVATWAAALSAWSLRRPYTTLLPIIGAKPTEAGR
jgi:hypothetical protein